MQFFHMNSLIRWPNTCNYTTQYTGPLLLLEVDKESAMANMLRFLIRNKHRTISKQIKSLPLGNIWMAGWVQDAAPLLQFASRVDEMRVQMDRQILGLGLLNMNGRTMRMDQTCGRQLIVAFLRIHPQDPGPIELLYSIIDLTKIWQRCPIAWNPPSIIISRQIGFCNSFVSCHVIAERHNSLLWDGHGGYNIDILFKGSCNPFLLPYHHGHSRSLPVTQ